MHERFDAAVVGAGSFGAWTALELQRRGRRVILLDAWGPGHSRSSSGGESRIIRMGYGPNEIYTRWSMRSLELWQGLFALTQAQLFHPTGVLWLGRAGDPYLAATRLAFESLGVPYRALPPGELSRLYPQMAIDEKVSEALLEPESGVLMARQAVAAVVAEAIREGVEYRLGAALPPSLPAARGAAASRLEAIATADGSTIRLGPDGVFIFACGPWLGKLFPDVLGDRIFNTRQEVFFFAAPAGNPSFRPGALPIWIDLTSEAYGMPDLDGRGVKIGIDRHGPAFDPDTGSREASVEAAERARDYLARRLPALKGAQIIETRVCQYANTSSGDFLLDRHPAFQNVWLAGGGSGHGFKHGPAVGEYLAARIVDDAPPEPRFSLETKQSVQNRSIF